MYKNYIFDLYGTLIDLNTNEWSNDLWKKMAIFYGYRGANYSYKELHSEYLRLVEKEKTLAQRRHKEYSGVDIKLEKVFKQLYKQKGVNASKNEILFTAEAFRCYSTKYIKLYDGVVDLLETLRAKGKRIYLLSNAQRVFTENELNMFDLTKYFDGICLSSDEECLKPDRNYYQILFDRYELKKNESIMIGNDHLADTGGATDFGIDSLYINQSISPEIEEEIRATYKIMDGNVFRIKELIVK